MAKLLTTASKLACPHGGTVTISSTNDKTNAGGNPVVRVSDTFTIAGCTLNVAGAPHPCVQVQWSSHATKVTVKGDFALTDGSQGMCLAGDGATQGAVLINSAAQTKVDGT